MSHRDDLIREFEKHYEVLRAFVRRRVRSPELTADILQDCYLRIARHPHAVPVDKPLALFRRIAGNLIIDRIRENEVRQRVSDSGGLSQDIPDRSQDVEAALIARQRFELLVRAVEELPPRCREVFLLRKVEQLESSEIARRLGISQNMVEKHLRKALLYCQAALAEHD